MLTRTLEQLLNRSLPRSPRAQQLVAELTGKSLAVVVPQLTRFRVASNGATLHLSREATPCDASVSGGPLSLLALAGDRAQAVLQRGDVRIEGDTEVAQKFRELGALLRPDFEEEIALIVGDVPAHQLGRVARLGGALARRTVDTTLMNLAEYLGHERADLVSRQEGEQFLRGVDALREDLDRLKARLELLARRRGGA
jgi:ubiquinone biosynthesis accessory factor UbiJ